MSQLSSREQVFNLSLLTMTMVASMNSLTLFQAPPQIEELISIVSHSFPKKLSWLLNLLGDFQDVEHIVLESVTEHVKV